MEDCEEFLVHFPTLERLALQCGPARVPRLQPGCNLVWWRLPPGVVEAATWCDGGCSCDVMEDAVVM